MAEAKPLFVMDRLERERVHKPTFFFRTKPYRHDWGEGEEGGGGGVKGVGNIPMGFAADGTLHIPRGEMRGWQHFSGRCNV